ncbi:MAG: Acryloyl-CoA reductase electron transfer subunit beta [Chloroflexi bacterium]|nr:Acryloyl-CoA reductase electron transfer subunit beta [Chloroflexota bacterium]
MSGILIYSEVKSTFLGLLTRGRALAEALDQPLTAALLGEESAAWAGEALSHGAERVFVGDSPQLDVFQARTYADALAQVAAQAEADIILTGSTLRGRELAPRLTQKLEAGCATDVTDLAVEDRRLITQRRALGGKTLSTEARTSPKQVIAVMPKLYEAEPGGDGTGEIVEIPLELEPSATRLVESKAKPSGGVDIEAAEILIGVGRGFEKEEDLQLAQDLADALGGAVGCTRPLSYDYNWLPDDLTIGLSGKICAPRLYIALGLSGQIQHTVGIMDSDVILAINKEKSAPMFKMSDYGIVGDLYEVVPRLVEKIRGAGN